MSSYIPLLVDMQGRSVVIFGGGAVAERKARYFCQGADVTVVSREFSAGILALAQDGRVALIQESLKEPRDDLMAGAFLVVPATSDRQLNRALEDAARRRGVLVNSVDRKGEVTIPSVVQQDQVVITVSTGVPALSRHIRQQLQGRLGGYCKMARLLADLRQRLKKAVPSQKRRRDILNSILSDPAIWSILDDEQYPPEQGYAKAYIRAREHLSPDERDCLDAGDTPQGIHRRD
ncbi:MAG: precorrin-2 dehydrogenase [Methanosaeta sp. PtaB.Bin039]|nr:MAG: precorrin-2 dehydrogenase [Methanosaeta sp. PtaB.Bin039]HOT07511.1 bifunctional precorrin-2 dehydrogenase/sirohydrochlorin ferrochelatase [Methanotrichaceae archaeon]HQF16109.1 bifunctional precorrin-2 dehydrogenase/sirohydrochlorin ferrochelatase [Methanotrichaceae archaeon]HQI90777.1 bifunctional precorrin-2 dehydrogenase/sirohydrochlorin ferrochelatase [Methanotrichaceae archaeon]HQJ28267.1 bifunctional precorrin-2 dehydrogenase/sirohydrochlorin ferrochelatase [Methanotrichaceae arch